MYGLKSVILAIFQKGLGWPCPVSAALKNVLGADEYLERLIGKIRKCLFFYVRIFYNNSVHWHCLKHVTQNFVHSTAGHWK